MEELTLEASTSDFTLSTDLGVEIIDITRLLAMENVMLGRNDVFVRTVLHIAASAGRLELMESLLDQGVNIDARDFDGSTPLMHALYSSQPAAAEALIARGANVNIAGNSGWSPLHEAVFRKMTAICVQLLACGAHVDRKYDSNNAAPLNVAVQYGYIDIVDILVEAGASINGLGQYTWSPLHSAAQYGSFLAASRLIEYGASLNTKFDGVFTPIYFAAAQSNSLIVHLLAEHGADADPELYKPMTIALEEDSYEGVGALLQLGCTPGLSDYFNDDDERRRCASLLLAHGWTLLFRDRIPRQTDETFVQVAISESMSDRLHDILLCGCDLTLHDLKVCLQTSAQTRAEDFRYRLSQETRALVYAASRPWTTRTHTFLYGTDFKSHIAAIFLVKVCTYDETI